MISHNIEITVYIANVARHLLRNYYLITLASWSYDQASLFISYNIETKSVYVCVCV